MPTRERAQQPLLERDEATGVERFETRWASHRTQRHAHPEYQITLSVEGVGRFFYLGGEARVPAGCVAIFHPGEPHSIGDDGAVPWHVRSLHVPPRWLEAEARPRLFPAPLLVDRALLEAFEAVWSAFDVERGAGAPRPARTERGARASRPARTERCAGAPRSAPTADDAMEEALRRLAGALVALPGLEPASRPGSELVRRCLAELAASLDRPLSLAELARRVGGSPVRVRRAITSATGIAPQAWHLQRRVEEAKHLLSRGDGIAATAAATGFADQAHFTRHFKRLVGVSPSRYAAGVRARDAGL
jgi:AraC-like DNA-binding protein/quercetin dioxygenase-like cupin family protein